MSCNRCENINRTGNVMGESGVLPSIALRGPGCINGTGRCNGVLGTGGVSCNELLNAFCGRCANNVGGAGESCCSNLLGASGPRCVNYSNNVQGTGGRNRCCRWSCEDLCTPTVVPR